MPRVMAEPYDPKFRGLLRRWRSHDLAVHEDLGSIRPPFYEGLRPEDEVLVWRYIEENYLLRYRELIGVRFEWTSDGLWRIPFPGSVGYGIGLSPSVLGLPGEVVAKIREWHDELDDLDRLEHDWVDHEASRAKGVEAAKAVKAFLSDAYYVEFEPFREIAMVDGAPVELGVPRYITDLAGRGSSGDAS
jgi:hypothetical protein